MKIIETMIVNNFPLNIVMHAFLESNSVEEIVTYYEKNSSNKKGNVLNFEINKA
jgi:hypothetical protein